MVDPRSLFDLTGKVACITGASSGLGRRAAGYFIFSWRKSNCKVARRKQALRSLSLEIGANAAHVAGDITDQRQLKVLCDFHH